MNLPIKIEMTVSEKLSVLRETMKENGVDAYVIANSDPHNGEYPAPHWMGREWISGFEGSNGTLVVTADKAGLWTDSRYYLIAEKALAGTGITLFRMNDEGVIKYIDWICQNLNESDCLGVHEETISRAIYSEWEKKCKISRINLAGTQDFLNEIWQTRPAIPTNKCYDFPLKFAGTSRNEKMTSVRQQMQKRSADYHVVTRVEEICWLLNLRGSDIEGQTSILAYILISQTDLLLFIDKNKLDPNQTTQLEEDGITIRGYSELPISLFKISNFSTVLINPDFINQNIYKQLSHTVTIEERDIITDLKATKNQCEIELLKECLKYDATALVKIEMWLEKEFPANDDLSEYKISQKLYEFRSHLPEYIHSSFPNIIAYNANGALNHYFVSEKTDTDIDQEGILLIDSGGTFFNGTTDTTRVYPLGTPTSKHKEDYTAVLKSMIGLSKTVFAQGTCGAGLDAICRQAMWKSFRNFKHGTGHGVGFCLNVHEGPQNINRSSTEEFKPGMVTTIEPGIYRPEDYGIRIENITLCKTIHENEFGKFLSFETLTRAPINTELIETSLLDEEEKIWLNDFHKTVFQDISPLLNEEEVEWLKKKCRKI